MKNSYDKVLVLPSSYVVMDEDEKEYLTGGAYNISYKLSYATTLGASNKACSVVRSKRWKKISTIDLAAEIYTHAYAYYYGSAFLSICSALGYSTRSIKKSSFWNSLSNGIDVINGKDTDKIGGIKRYVLFRAFFAYAMANPGMI